MPEPIYTRGNCHVGGELKWGFSVFWRTPVNESPWLEQLAAATKSDGIDVRRHRFAKPGVSQFELSTRADVSPYMIVQRVKGRLQYLVRDRMPKPFQKNYALRSIGYVTRDIIEQYVANQTKHHIMADPAVQQRFERFQIHQAEIDLSEPQQTSHGVYWYNLHVTMVHEHRCTEIRETVLARIREMILNVSRAKGHLLSRAGILADHIHLALGCPFNVAPDEIALCYMNNLAFVHGMKPVFQYGVHLRTFSEYDLGAVKGAATGSK
jgi:REP element-mobilizing transposase RayT